ncbi:MAG TPA: hypothetical protein VEC16_06550 [Alphaproteobacteria bacterium]|nr:hypothetical protein [Alphaproteobacteria bacterium]
MGLGEDNSSYNNSNNDPDDEKKKKLKKLIDDLNKEYNQYGHQFVLSTDEIHDELMKELKRVKTSSLNDLVNEELPKILYKDPTVFTRYDVSLPDNHQWHLFELYQKTSHKKDMDSVFYSAKLYFHDIFRYVVESDDQRRLDLTMDKYKKILEGEFIPVERWD